MNTVGMPPRIAVIGGGMITHDQLLPSLYHLQRLGELGSITVCARSAKTVAKLAGAQDLLHAFPGQAFHPEPDPEKDPVVRDPQRYLEVITGLPPHQIVMIAVPDAQHHEMTMAALRADQHVLIVKPLVQLYQQAQEIDEFARERGLFVGVEYHKRFDRRVLLARESYAAGRFGEFRAAEARMIEPFCYRGSNFQNWFTTDQADPFTYVGCHYVDQVYFITGLRPAEVSVVGIEGEFPNGNRGFMWSGGRVVFENGGILNVLNGLGYPDDAPGTNDQGLTMFCDNGKRGGIIRHNDQFRGVKHAYVDDGDPGGAPARYVNPDYLKLVPWEGDGLQPVGYGYDSVAALVRSAARVQSAGEGCPEDAALEERRRVLEEIDEKGLIATPANSWINELVTEAGRHSILHAGQRVRIVYGGSPHIEPV
jgi:D-galacturonate reductase